MNNGTVVVVVALLLVGVVAFGYVMMRGDVGASGTIASFMPKGPATRGSGSTSNTSSSSELASSTSEEGAT